MWMHIQSAKLQYLIQIILMRSAARYLLQEKRRKLALDPVAHFHLRNGAKILRINWMSDLSERGLVQSFGICVNFGYHLDEIYENNRMYLVEHRIKVSEEVLKLLGT